MRLFTTQRVSLVLAQFETMNVLPVSRTLGDQRTPAQIPQVLLETLFTSKRIDIGEQLGARKVREDVLRANDRARRVLAVMIEDTAVLFVVAVQRW